MRCSLGVLRCTDMQALRSLLFNAVMFGSVTIYALLSLLTWPFRARAYRFISQWAPSTSGCWARSAGCVTGRGTRAPARDRTAGCSPNISPAGRHLPFSKSFRASVGAQTGIVAGAVLRWGWRCSIRLPSIAAPGARRYSRLSNRGVSGSRAAAGGVFPEGSAWRPSSIAASASVAAALAAASGHRWCRWRTTPATTGRGAASSRGRYHPRGDRPLIDSRGSQRKRSTVWQNWISETMARLEAKSPAFPDQSRLGVTTILTTRSPET